MNWLFASKNLCQFFRRLDLVFLVVVQHIISLIVCIIKFCHFDVVNVGEIHKLLVHMCRNFQNGAWHGCLVVVSSIVGKLGQ